MSLKSNIMKKVDCKTSCRRCDICSICHLEKRCRELGKHHISFGIVDELDFKYEYSKRFIETIAYDILEIEE